MKRAKTKRYKPTSVREVYRPKNYKWTSPFEEPLDLTEATAATIDELRKSISSNRLVTITIQIN